jgi:hypothetical protein
MLIIIIIIIIIIIDPRFVFHRIHCTNFINYLPNFAD